MQTKAVFFIAFLAFCLIGVNSRKAFRTRNLEQQGQGQGKGQGKLGGEVVTAAPEPLPCVLEIDDFSNPQLGAQLDQFATINKMGLNTGTDDTMGQAWDRVNNRLTLEVWGNNSYWYSFLGHYNEQSCFDASKYYGVRFVLSGTPTLLRWRVGVQIGAKDRCIRDKTYFLQWTDGVMNYAAGSDTWTVDFPFDKFTLLEEDKKNILAVELSGFLKIDTHKMINLSHVQLIQNECALPRGGAIGGESGQNQNQNQNQNKGQNQRS